MDENTQAKFDEKLKEILTASKKKGYAEYQEVIDTFAEFNLEEDQFDKIWEALDKNKIVLRIETIEDDDIPEEELSMEDAEDLDLDVENLEKSLKKSTADLKGYLDGSDAKKSKAFRSSLKSTENTLRKDIASLKISSRRLIK
mgnify:CR=1 FL=1